LNDDASRFSSFFEKSRWHLKGLDHRIGDDDDDESDSAPLLEKSNLPMLRDLTVDPSNLCKAACGFARLSSENPHVKGSWTLTRVAVRLLSSKDGQLMKECSIHDIVRLCEAAVMSEVAGHGRELVIGLFARKVVQVLNQALEADADDKGGTSLELASATPSEISTLVNCLGELGARHSLIRDEGTPLAHRRMLLVVEKPLLSKEQLETLDASSVMRLMRGLVAMHFFRSDRRFLHDVLLEVQKNASRVSTASELCGLAESLAVIKEAVRSGDSARVKKEMPAGTENSESALTDLTITNSKASEPIENSDKDDPPPLIDDASIDIELVDTCDGLLNSVAKHANDVVGKLRADELRRLLAVYALLPFQADHLIDTIEKEVEKRMGYLTSMSSTEVVEDLLQEAAANSMAVNKTLFGESHAGDSRLSAIKKGLRSLFMSSDSSEDMSDDNVANVLTAEVSSMIQEAADSAYKAVRRLEGIGSAALVSPDRIIQDIEEGAAFELGRCQELIKSYRRVEFSTGKRKSRYDKVRRRDISKRVLSRLLP
jgi:hypothetical protein